ncbi:MAG TPA: outer membrane protein [Pseudolabrys sp.]
MKRLVLASLGVLAVATIMSSANAADIARRHAMPTKAPLYAAPYNWTGLYVGINGGGGFGTSNVATVPSGSFNTNGGLVGGTIGYNWQMGQTVFGLEGDIDWTDLRGSGTCAGTTCETRNSWLSTARGRLGYAFDRFLPFISGGAAFGDIQNNITGIGSATETRVGWTVGGGLEAAIAGPWSAKIEYLYADLGRGASVLGSDASFKTNIVRGGLNYRFW